MMNLGQNGPLLLDICLKATLLLVLAGLACLALRRASAAARGLLWSATLAGLLALPLVALGLPKWNVTMPESALSLLTPPGNLVVRTAAPTAGEPQRQNAESTPGEPRGQAGAEPRFAWNSLGGLTLLWLAGAVLLIIRLASSYLIVHGWIRRSAPLSDLSWNHLLEDEKARLDLRREVTLISSDRVTTPMTCGFLRSFLVLPTQAEDWDTQRRRLVLRHELAHVERRDCLMQIVVQLACCLHWLNPLVWLASWRYALERERACDDRVLSLGARPTDYASHLLDIAHARSTSRLAALSAVALSAIRLSTVGMARSSELEGRLLAILDSDLRRGLSRRVGALTAASVLAACLTLAVVHPVIGDEGVDGKSQTLLVQRDIESLITELSSPEREIRHAAAQSLGASGDTRAVEPLVDALRDPYWEVREQVASALGHFGDRRVVPELIKSLADGHWQVRHLAAAALGELADPRALGELSFVLRDPEVGVREQAAIALGKLGERRAIPALTEALFDHHRRVREHAAEALGRLGKAQALNALTSALLDDEWQVREKAAMAYGLCGGLNGRGIEAMLDLLNDDHWQVRDIAFRLLSRLDDVRVEEALQRGVEDPSTEV